MTIQQSNTIDSFEALAKETGATITYDEFVTIDKLFIVESIPGEFEFTWKIEPTGDAYIVA